MAKRPIDRVRNKIDRPQPADLASLPGTELTTILLEAMRLRTARLSPSDVAHQSVTDRFVAPGSVDLRTLHTTEAILLAELPETFDAVTLSPLAPTGIHSTIGRVNQNNVVSTVRRTDVAADPTVGLALEAAKRRKEALRQEARSATEVRLATIQRVVRAQVFDGPQSYPHFTIFGLATAGRDSGHRRFEIDAVTEHATILCRALLATDADEVALSIADWVDGALGDLPGRVGDAIDDDRLATASDPGRTRARGYYESAALEVDIRFGDSRFNAADGGLVDWSRQLLGNRKERLMISGIGVDRIAIARSAPRSSE